MEKDKQALIILFLNKKLDLPFLKGPDYFITKFINLFI